MPTQPKCPIPDRKVIYTDPTLWVVGDTKRLKTVNPLTGVGAQLNGALWTALSGASVMIIDPSGQGTYIAGTQDATAIFGVNFVPTKAGPHLAMWTLTDGTNTESWGWVLFPVIPNN